MEKFTIEKIDLNKTNVTEIVAKTEEYYSPASITLGLGALAIQFARVERMPRYDENSRENDAEHSFMLALVANELVTSLYPELDGGKVTQFAIVHDLIETVTGDVATFKLTAEQMATKQMVEHEALGNLIKKLPFRTGQLLYEYEQQQAPEARFVKAVDKLLPVAVDILGQGQKVMREDYDITTIDELEAGHAKLHARIAQSFAEFPAIVEAHSLLCELLKLEFEVIPKR
jgi:5'-deoxynucleotidase YfbR-like HD superfamily hydrolase